MTDIQKELRSLFEPNENEFSEVATCDMESVDTAWHYWQQEKYNKERERWETKRQMME